MVLCIATLDMYLLHVPEVHLPIHVRKNIRRFLLPYWRWLIPKLLSYHSWTQCAETEHFRKNRIVHQMTGWLKQACVTEFDITPSMRPLFKKQFKMNFHLDQGAVEEMDAAIREKNTDSMERVMETLINSQPISDIIRNIRKESEHIRQQEETIQMCLEDVQEKLMVITRCEERISRTHGCSLLETRSQLHQIQHSNVYRRMTTGCVDIHHVLQPLEQLLKTFHFDNARSLSLMWGVFVSNTVVHQRMGHGFITDTCYTGSINQDVSLEMWSILEAEIEKNRRCKVSCAVFIDKLKQHWIADETCRFVRCRPGQFQSERCPLDQFIDNELMTLIDQLGRPLPWLEWFRVFIRHWTKICKAVDLEQTQVSTILTNMCKVIFEQVSSSKIGSYSICSSNNSLSFTIGDFEAIDAYIRQHVEYEFM